MGEVFLYSYTRNKAGIKNVLPKSIKKDLYQGVCDYCRKDRIKGQLEVEHEIPVKALGKIFDKSNIKLTCSECHKKKTRIDILVINTLKKMKLLDNSHCFVNPELIIKTYKHLFSLFSLGLKNHERWYTGTEGEDYITQIWNKNREVSDE